jgi:hypothetical protein
MNVYPSLPHFFAYCTVLCHVLQNPYLNLRRQSSYCTLVPIAPCGAFAIRSVLLLQRHHSASPGIFHHPGHLLWKNHLTSVPNVCDWRNNGDLIRFFHLSIVDPGFWSWRLHVNVKFQSETWIASVHVKDLS